MMRIAAVVAVAITACGDNDRGALADAALPHGPACMASFTGNFLEASSTITPCATVAASPDSPGPDSVLEIVVPSMTLGTAFTIEIDLGASPAAAEYSSETVATWSATASEDVGGPDCIYLANNATAPRGDFTLTLDEIDAVSGAVHGTFEVLMYVLTPPFTSCGLQMTEMLVLTF